MAVYYWLGTQASTGTGNVNVPTNWTFTPGGVFPQIPSPAGLIPGNNDTIVFTKYVVGSAIYPLYSPGGTLGSGVSGTTAFVASINVLPDCPVSLGICGQNVFFDEPFRVNTANFNLSTNASSPAITASHYIEFKNNRIGPTPPTYDPKVIINTSIPTGNRRTFRLSGVAANLTIGNLAGLTSNSIVYLNDITLTENSNTPPLSNKAFQTGSGSRDTIYISKDAKIKNAYLLGSSSTYIYPGFGCTGLVRLVSNNAAEPSTMEFVSGISYGEATVTKIDRLEIVGDLNRPIVNVNHGLGITHLNQNGGTITFNVPAGTTQLMCNVYEGMFNVANGSQLISEYGTLTLGEGPVGSGGSFLINNTTGPGFGKLPRIMLKGMYNVDVFSAPQQE